MFQLSRTTASGRLGRAKTPWQCRNMPGDQQHGVDRGVDLRGRLGQVFHAGDRPVEQAVIDGDHHRPAVADKRAQAATPVRQEP